MAHHLVFFFLLLVMSNVDSVGVYIVCHYCVSLVVFFANTLKWLHQHQHQRQ